MSSTQGPCGEAASQGRCCANSTCSRAVRQSFMDLLQNDVFLTPCEGVGGETERRPESETDVWPATIVSSAAFHTKRSSAGTRHTHIHTNTYARVGEHHGEGGYTRPTGANKFSTALNNNFNRKGSGGATLEAGKANDEEEGQAAGGTRAVAQGEEETERRLCGGCHEPKKCKDFTTQEWQKEDAWSREAARRCQACTQESAQQSAGGDGQGRRPKRKAAVRAQHEESGGFSEECAERRLEQVLCPRGCKCGNALATSGSPAVVQEITGGGGELKAKGVMAVAHIAPGTIVTCFGSSACVQTGPASEELQSIMNGLEEGEGERCQYTCAHNLQGHTRFGPTKVWVVPPPDITLILRQAPSDTLKKALKQRGPEGVGHFIDHSCCPQHTNAELVVRWTSEIKDMATVVVVAKKPILPGEWVWVNYAPEDGTLAAWEKRFSCTCCRCRGACGDGQRLGINHLVTAIRASKPTKTPWGRGWEQAGQEEVLGLRVRARLTRGNLEGNIIHVQGSRVQVRGTLEGGGKGVKTCNLVTEEVALKECRIVEDNLTWSDQYIPSAAVRRVEFQSNARHDSDCLEETVVEMMLKWGFYGHTADHGLRPVSTRQWVASVWEYPYLLEAWETVKNSDEPLIELLQLLSQQEPEPQRKRGGRSGTKIKFLPVDPAMYDFIFIPICIAGGKHWLLASIDVQKCEMQLLDCSKNYSGRWRGQIHSILWVWFVASVRRLRARGAATQEEPQWRIDISHVNLLDIAELPGLRSSQMRNHLVECGLKKCAPNITKLLGGAERSCLAALNITVDEDRSTLRQWRWSSIDAEAPQQRRGSDCGLLTVLFAIFKARGWAMQALGSLNPEDIRNWFLGVLNGQGQWRRAWSCTKCGAEIARWATVDDRRQCLADVTCEKAKWQACKARRLRRSEHQQSGASETLGEGRAEGGAQGPPPGAHLPQTMLGKRGVRGLSPRRINHTESSAGGPHNQGTIVQCPTAEVEGELRSNGCNNGAVHAERRSVGVGDGASDIKNKRLEDTGLPVWMTPSRVTDAGSQRTSD